MSVSTLIEDCRAKVRRFTSPDIKLIKGSKDFSDQTSDLDIPHGQWELRIEEEESDILADQRRTPTIEDDIVLILLNSMMESITESYTGKKCMKPVLKRMRSMQNDMVILKQPTEGTEEVDSLAESKNLGSVGTPTQKSISSKRKGSEDSEGSENKETPIRTPHTGSSVLSRRSKTRSSFLKNFRKIGSSKVRQALKETSSFKGTSGNRISKVIEETLSMLEDYAKGSIDDYEVLEEMNDVHDRVTKQTTDWRVSFPDEDVFMVFTQGNEYEGRISRKLMEGHGTFKWNDGSSYEGDFAEGEITGRGKMTFSDLSWYEGEFFRGLRHGNGIYVSYDNDTTYSGHWFLGNMHGVGTLYFGDTDNNYYTGEFFNGEFHGYGSRQYPSGARYFGEWIHGIRYGNGTMVFKNFDVYIGNWENGLMNGQGEYIWNAFVNETFTQPIENIFRGNWVEGLRTGRGTLLRSCRANIFGEWLKNMKHGPGMVVCLDGRIVRGNPLFIEDHLIENPDSTESIVNPSIVLPEKKLTREITSVPGLRRTGKKIVQPVSRTKLQSKVSLAGVNKKLNTSRIFHESRGNPLKINLHQSEFVITYQALRLLEFLGKGPIKLELEQESQVPSKTSTSNDTSNVEKVEGAKQDFSSELHKASYSMRDASSMLLAKYPEKESVKLQNTDNVICRQEEILKEPQICGSYAESDSIKPEDAQRGTSLEENTSIRHEHTKEKEEPQDTSYESKSLKQPSFDNEFKALMAHEIKWLKKVILLNIYELRRTLKTYSTITTKHTLHETIALRIMIWQFERDCGFNNKGFSLVEVDERVAMNPDSHVLTVYDPSEKIEFYQFLQYLLELSWMLYASKGIGYEGAPGTLASAFMKLLHDDIYPNIGKHQGNVLFEYLDLLPLDTVYLLYKSFGEPHTARRFLTKVCLPRGAKLPDPPENCIVNWYPEHIRNGTNVIYLSNNLIYLPKKEPLSYSRKNPKDWHQPPEDNTVLDPYGTKPICLRNLGPKKVIEILVSVCPAIKSAGLICNMDYKLTFLEFYEVLLKCAEESILKEKLKAAKAAKMEAAPPEASVAVPVHKETKKTKSRQTSAQSPKTKKKRK